MNMMKKLNTTIAAVLFVAIIFVSMEIVPLKVYAGSTTYIISDTGPSGGYIFYDKGYDSDAWCYLETASGYGIRYP